MIAFEQFLQASAEKGEAINLVFEQRLFELVGVLHKIAAPLAAANVPYELVGGLAVLVHVEEKDPSQSMLTRDVDLMIRRADVDRVIAIAADHGLPCSDSDSARNSVHLLFSGEKVRPNQATPNPDISPVLKSIHGEDVSVIPLADLLRMKLSSWRLKDQVHVQVMDAAGLITPFVEESLKEELQARLAQVRASD